MAYDDSDYFDYPDERDPDYETVLERARTAGQVAEAMRAEENALLELEGLSPRSQISPGGTIQMPSPVMSQPLPPPGGGAITPPGGRVIQMPQASDPQAAAESLAAQQKYEAMRMYQFYTSNGMPAAQAMQLTGMNLFAPTGTGGMQTPKPMSEYQQAQVARWNAPAQLTPFQEQQVSRWEREDALKASKADPEVARRIRQLEDDIRELEMDIAKNRPLRGQAFDDRSYILAKWKQELEQLRSAGTRGPAPGTQTGTAPAGSPFREGQIVRSKTSGQMYRITNGQPVPMR